jgi:heme exporter protein D
MKLAGALIALIGLVQAFLFLMYHQWGYAFGSAMIAVTGLVVYSRETSKQIFERELQQERKKDAMRHAEMETVARYGRKL